MLFGLLVKSAISKNDAAFYVIPAFNFLYKFLGYFYAKIAVCHYSKQ